MTYLIKHRQTSINNDKKQSCNCNINKCKEKKKPYIITNQNEMPEWVIILKKKNMEMFR